MLPNLNLKIEDSGSSDSSSTIIMLPEEPKKPKPLKIQTSVTSPRSPPKAPKSTVKKISSAVKLITSKDSMGLEQTHVQIEPDQRGIPDNMVTLSQYLQDITEVSPYTRVSSKEVKVQASANKQEGWGGVYRFNYSYEFGSKLLSHYIYFKQTSKKPHHDIAEVLGSGIENAIIGDRAASVIVVSHSSSLKEESSENVFVGSVMYPSSSPGWRLFHERYNISNPTKQVEIPKKRPKRAGTGWPHIFKNGISAFDEKSQMWVPRDADFYPVLAVQAFLANFDTHFDNILRIFRSGKHILNSEEVKSLAIKEVSFRNGKSEAHDAISALANIDMGWCFEKLFDPKDTYFDPISNKEYKGVANIHIRSHSRHTTPMRPTNHFREIPVKLLFQEDFAVALDEIALQDSKALGKIIDDKLALCARYYGLAGLVQFAAHMQLTLKNTDKLEAVLSELKTKMAYAVQARQAMCRELAFEIRLSQCFNIIDKTVVLDEEKFKKLVSNPANVFFINKSLKNTFHFRGENASALKSNRADIILQIKKTMGYSSEESHTPSRLRLFDSSKSSSKIAESRQSTVEVSTPSTPGTPLASSPTLSSEDGASPTALTSPPPLDPRRPPGGVRVIF